MNKNSLIISIFMVCASILTVSAAKKSITGTVTCDGKGVAGQCDITAFAGLQNGHEFSVGETCLRSIGLDLFDALEKF